MRINGNDLARIITRREGKKVSLPIAQVKEVVKLVRGYLRAYPDAEIRRWINS